MANRSYTFTVPKAQQMIFSEGVKHLRKCHRRLGGTSKVKLSGEEVTIDLSGPNDLLDDTLERVLKMDWLLIDYCYENREGGWA